LSPADVWHRKRAHADANPSCSRFDLFPFTAIHPVSATDHGKKTANADSMTNPHNGQRRTQMTRIWVTIALSLVLTSCGSDEVRQSSTDVLQRRQIQQENVAREARVREEQAELAQAREQQGQRHEAAQRAAQTEVPVVQPLEPIPIEMEPLEAPRAMPENPDSAFAKRTIYYAYDAYNLAEEYRSLVEAHSRFLLAHKDYKLRTKATAMIVEAASTILRLASGAPIR
jgi:outer membrane protein OmpA-like peptidoglycan-associated protein